MPTNAEWSAEITKVATAEATAAITPEKALRLFTAMRQVLLGDADLGLLERIQIVEEIDDKLAVLASSPPPPPLTPPTVEAEQSDELKRSFDIFCVNNGLPTRESKPEFSDILKYLQAFHEALLDLASMVVNDGHLSGSSSPVTADYKKDPFRGPNKPLNLLKEDLLYSKKEWQSIFSFDSLYTLMPDLFSTAKERLAVKGYCEREKRVFEQIAVWHNRGHVRRENIGESGPEPAFVGIRQIYERKSANDLSANIGSLFPSGKPESPLLEIEKRFQEAIEYSMAVWSVMLLPLKDRKRLWSLIDPRITGTFFGTGDMADPDQQFRIKKEYDQLPTYRGTSDKQVALIELIISKIQSMGLSKKQALLAYSLGENFRIGGGMEGFFDASFGGEKPTGGFSPDANVSVMAQEGEPKACNIGLYVDSAAKNTSRPDFVVPFADYLSHGYVPYAVACQFGYTPISGRNDIGDFADGRATLAELLAVKGGVKNIKWDTASTNPDKVVFQLANQAVNFLWPSASLKKATTPEHAFFVDTKGVPLATTFLLDRERERLRIADELGWYFSKGGKGLFTSIVNKLAGRPELPEFERHGFHSESSPLDQGRVQRIKAMYKDARDYWLDAAKADQRYPFDAMRIYKYLFSRDDGPNGYVNKKIGDKIESTKSESASNPVWLKEKVAPWLQAYVSFDVLLRSLYYLLAPDYRKSELGGALSADELDAIYKGLSYDNYDRYLIESVAGTRPMNVNQVLWLINQSMLIRDLVPPDSSGKSETERMFDAGYKLYYDAQACPDNIFDHEDLLALAKEFGMGQGYEVGVVKSQVGSHFYTLNRVGDHATRQWIVDRLTLCLFLFNPSKLNLSKK